MFFKSSQRLTNAITIEKRDASLTAYLVHDLIGLSMDGREVSLLSIDLKTHMVTYQQASNDTK